MAKARVGLLGCGEIGGFIARHVLADGADDITLSYVFDTDEKKLTEIPPACRVTSQADLFSRSADLVVEAVHADLVKSVALRLPVPDRDKQRGCWQYYRCLHAAKCPEHGATHLQAQRWPTLRLILELFSVILHPSAKVVMERGELNQWF
ncbi:MAG: NAD(P)-binding domain-containing protein [bacterium]